jgi:glycerophosphoryl diester phosphodiesterase
VRFNIDVKDWPAVRPVAEVIARTGAWDRVCVTSFSGRRLGATRRALDRPVCMATAPAGIAAIRHGVPPQTLAARFAAMSVQCTQIPYGLATARYVRRARAAGLAVHVWTVNDPEVMAAMLDLGVDGIMTDQTEALREVMIARGAWNPRA